MKLQKFNGGLSTRKEPYLIGTAEGQTYTNILNDEESLQPAAIPEAAGLSYTQNHRYLRYSDTVEQFLKTPLDFVEYKNKVYYSVENDFMQMRDTTGEGNVGLFSPQILLDTVGVTAVRPSTPISADITITPYNSFIFFGAPDAATYSAWYFSVGVTYTFAFQRVAADGSLSDFYEYTWTCTTPPNGSIYAQIQLSLPFNYKVYLKNAGVWYNVAGVVGYDPTPTQFDFTVGDTTLVYIGTANQPVILSKASFTSNTTQVYPNGIGYPFIDTGVVPASYSTTSSIVELTIVEAAGSDLPAGTYYYVATVEASTLGWESEPSAAAVATIVTGEQISFTITEFNNLDVQVNNGLDSDTRVDRLNIYRVGGNLTDFTLVTTIENPVWPISFNDNYVEEAIVGNEILFTEDNDMPLTGLKNLAIVAGQLCGTIGTKLYFSRAGFVFAFPSTNFREFREDLTGLYVIDAGLLIFSRNKTWLLNTSNLAFGKIIQISDEFGCTSHNTISGYRTGALWNTLYGVCSSFGGKVELITKDSLGFTNLSIIKAVTHNEIYWGFTEQGTIYAVDTRYGLAIKFFDFAIFQDNLVDTVVHQLYRTDAELNVLFGSDVDVDSYQITNGSELATMVWKSAKFIEGSLTDRKTYKDIYVRATANINFKVYIEDGEEVLVADETFRSLDTHQIKIDSSLLQGYAIHFEVVGTGTVYEIEYKAMGRQNGR